MKKIRLTPHYVRRLHESVSRFASLNSPLGIKIAGELR